MELKRNIRKAAELGAGLTAIATLILAGCGGGGGASGGGATTSATITPFKGPFSSGATVTLKDANGNPVSLISGGMINASGVANVTYSANVTYPLIVEVSGSYYNENTGAMETATVPLRGLISSAGAASSVPVTIVTETAVADLQTRLGSFAPAHPIQAASAVAALNVAGAMLGIPASAVPAFNPATHQTSDRDTLRLAAWAVVANGLTGTTLVDRVRALANSLAALNSASAPADVIGQAAYDSALTAMTNGGASSVMAAGTAAPTPPAIPTSNHAALYASAVAAASAGGSASVTCNTAHYTAGAVRVPTSAEMTSYAKTYSGNTIDQNTSAVTGATTFVFSATGGLTYNGAVQTVASICKDNTLPMMYVEFGNGGSVDFFADGTFTGFTSTAMFQSAGFGTGGTIGGTTGGTVTQGFTNGSFGTLTLSGASAAGTSFGSQSAFVGGDPMLNFYSWASGASVSSTQPPYYLALPTTNSTQVVINTNKTTNALNYVGVNLFGATANIPVATWGTSTGLSGVSVNLTAKTVTFNNVVLSGVTGTGYGTTLTLNGTISLP